MARRTWRGIRTPKYEQPARAGEVVMTSSPLHGSGSQAERDPALHEQEEDDDRDRDQRRPRHHDSPVDVASTTEEVRQPERNRLLRVRVQDDVREDVLVPRRDEDEDRGRDETGRDERQQDADEGAEAGRAVDHRGLLELLGYAEQEAAQCPDRERQRERDVHEDDSGQRVHLAVAAEHHVERDDQTDRRQHLDADQQDDEDATAGEAVLRERYGREKCEHEPDAHGDGDDDERVLDVGPEVGAVKSCPEVRERGMQRDPRRVVAVDLLVGLEGTGDHPEDGEDHDGEHEQPEGVPAEPAREPAFHSTSPTFSIRRTYTTLIAATVTSINIEIAAPRPKSVPA